MPTELNEPIIGLKTSELSSANNLTGVEYVCVIQNGSSRKAQTAQWVALLNASVLPPKTLVKAAGSPVPVIINNLQVGYAGYNSRPQVRKVNGDGTFIHYSNAAITILEVAGQPDSVHIDVANDGRGHLLDSIQITFNPY